MLDAVVLDAAAVGFVPEKREVENADVGYWALVVRQFDSDVVAKIFAVAGSLDQSTWVKIVGCENWAVGSSLTVCFGALAERCFGPSSHWTYPPVSSAARQFLLLVKILLLFFSIPAAHFLRATHYFLTKRGLFWTPPHTKCLGNAQI